MASMAPQDGKSDMRWRLKAITGGSIGNLVEWYDWYAYSAFTLYFADHFFPGSNPTTKLIDGAGVFAVGFLMRPAGGYIFGRLADKKGRKMAMTLSVLLMSSGSLLIALLPGYSSIGIAAPLLLLLARLLQGLSVGGEYGTSATYLSEVAAPNKRGFYSSFQYVTLIGGQLIALALQLSLQHVFLNDAQLHAWGWRIPFFVGAVLSLVAFYLRRHLRESDAFEKENAVAKNKGNFRELLKHPKAIATVAGLTLGGTLAFYTYTTYMQKFLVNTAGFSKNQSTVLSFCSLFLFACLQPLFGMLSDRVGRRPLLLSFGILGTLCTIPLLTSLSHAGGSMWNAFALLMMALLIVSGYTSINAVVKAEIFPVEVRALGVGLPYSVTVAIFGGTAEYIALWAKKAGHENYFYWYVTACIFISLLVYFFMKDSKKTSLLETSKELNIDN